MDPFTYLPYDKMYEICENLNDKDLSRLVRTSKKAYETCQWMVDRRKEEKERREEEEFQRLRVAVENSGITGRFDIINSKLRIVFPHSYRGIDCMTLAKNQLLNILQQWDLPISPEMTKQKICALISKTLDAYGKLTY